MKSIVHQHRKVEATPADMDGAEESLYAKWSRVCLDRCPTQCELPQFLGVLPPGRQIFRPPFVNGERADLYRGLINTLGVDRSAFSYLAGQDIFRAGDCGTLARRNLRYCPRCIAHGYHATLFQHVAIEKCPLHDVPLLGTCALCGYAFKPTWESVARDPFACSRCGNLLLRTVADARRDIEIRLVELMVAERRRLLDLGDEHKSRFRIGRPTDSVSMELEDLDVRLRRRVLRHALWTGATLPGWSAGKVSNFHLAREEGSSGRKIFIAASATILAILRKLRALCSDREADIVRVASHLDSLQSGLRMQVPACATAAAYCKTAYLYGVNPLYRMTDPKRRTDIDIEEVDSAHLVLRSCWVPQSIQANRILAELEVLGLFCLVLKQVASCKRVVDIGWSECPEEEAFCPAWCLDKNGVSFSVRPRATWRLVNWMIARYSWTAIRP
ncbi:hypothetical protein [Ralstonia sp. ASV6]|uniref:hypothetical protein n=1 Tax=Ralstonia sp. ASV6 TaxID=2795124 RepID=UPI0018EDA751|nr:hypothetical protein [Ralstonia sp. ASV6]